MIDRRDGENRLAMDTAVWPYGRGEMAERIRTFNWGVDNRSAPSYPGRKA